MNYWFFFVENGKFRKRLGVKPVQGCPLGEKSGKSFKNLKLSQNPVSQSLELFRRSCAGPLLISRSEQTSV